MKRLTLLLFVACASIVRSQVHASLHGRPSAYRCPAGVIAQEENSSPSTAFTSPESVTYHTENIDGLDIFYREAGSRNNPTILLLHGFPTSSFMFRNLIPALSKNFHLIAPDYPGFGNSSMPLVTEYDYTFDNFALVIEKLLERMKVRSYILYLMDYGAPVGFRLAVKHPKRVKGLIIQNGNAYKEGLKDFWNPVRVYWKNKNEKTAQPLLDLFTLKTTKSQYLTGARKKETISPDTWNMDQHLLDRPGNKEIQLALFYDYGTNLARYPAWQAYFRKYQPRALIMWGKNDIIFPIDGAYLYKRDLKNVELHELNTGHFALEEDGPFIAQSIIGFFSR